MNGRGLNTSAAFGFTTTLLDLIKREDPTHLAVVLDAQPPSRHGIRTLLDYGKPRGDPDDMRSNRPSSGPIESFNIPILESDGYEADGA